MKTIKFYISAFIYAYKNDPNFRMLLRSIYECLIFIIFGICSLVFLALLLLNLSKN